MRPQSIRRFDLFYLAALALSILAFLLGYDDIVGSVEAESAAAGLQMGANVAIGSFAFGVLLYLLLWFLVSRRRVGIARWIIVLLFLVNLTGVRAIFTAGLSLQNGISLLSLLLSAIAIYYLFRPETKAWLEDKRSADGSPVDPE
jgi:uncharacterized membrane-anchored protein